MGGGTQAMFLEVLEEAVGILDQHDIAHLAIGGVATGAYVRPNWDPEGSDIDILISADDADRALDAFAQEGYAVEKKDSSWIYKAARPDVTVDLIFRPSGDFQLDDEMVERAGKEEFRGVQVRVPCPEDLIAMKAVAHNEDAEAHWHDALRILTRFEIDWQYLTKRALKHGPYRMLSLLYYVLSMGFPVDRSAIEQIAAGAEETPG